MRSFVLFDILILILAVLLSDYRLLQEPHGVTTQKTAFFIVTAVKTSNDTYSEDLFLNYDFLELFYDV
jgi:hypothetical protein